MYYYNHSSFDILHRNQVVRLTQTRVATEVQVEFVNRIRVIFPNNYELRLVSQLNKRAHSKDLHNVQLYHDKTLIARYDGVLEIVSSRDKNAELLSPQKMAVGSKDDLIPFWEGALRYIDIQFRKYKAEYKDKPKPLTESEELYAEDVQFASEVASCSEKHLKRLKRQPGRRWEI